MIPLAKFFHLPPSTFERSENPIPPLKQKTIQPRSGKPGWAGAGSRGPTPSVLGLWLILIFISALAPSRGRANPPVLVAEDGTFLGVASANVYDPDSTSNPFGQYGSQFSATSINNPYSLYGSQYSAESATNPYLVSEPEEK